ncbi:MAG TPA: hypothetical protein PLW97_13380, partial [Synergistaceae bacterium]|nr:hypothetical protein [Synergistaceae bacterium]
MGGEELGGGGDVFGGCFFILPKPCVDLVFSLGDVELVEPPQHFHVAAVLGSKRLSDLCQHGFFAHQIPGHEEKEVVPGIVKHAGKEPGVVEAGPVKEHPVGLLLGVGRGDFACKNVPDPGKLHVGSEFFGDLPSLGLLEQLREGEVFSRGDHPQRGVLLHIHKAEGAEAVEPGVGPPADHRIFGGA